MKFRKRSSKIKYEHAMIKGLRRLLERIEGWEEIKSIIPGRISPTQGSGSLTLNVQYPTEAGLKCLAKRSDSVQEVFFVSSNPEALKEKIEKLATK